MNMYVPFAGLTIGNFSLSLIRKMFYSAHGRAAAQKQSWNQCTTYLSETGTCSLVQFEWPVHAQPKPRSDLKPSFNTIIFTISIDSRQTLGRFPEFPMFPVKYTEWKWCSTVFSWIILFKLSPPCSRSDRYCQSFWNSKPLLRKIQVSVIQWAIVKM
jgi:hypothetical protein